MPDASVPELAHTGRLDRHRDLAGWLLTPLITLVVAPVMAGAVGMVVLVGGAFDRTPALCESALGDNRCEEVTLGMLGEHAVLSAAVWLLLWLVPWWRGLRKLRVLLAIIDCAVLVAAPIRMAR
ncbi:hypothetical protein GA0070607_0143 [Micromonospora coriariae]|uniref:Uncharacterized protein n=1 Tax=Micromonospora coriariae TaxID=285665 RepID=A0A1C4U4L5_9ACTN|nr:hypothetical protein [Micromonospora coriariae]SCE66648.1 hypothetical protein GA0070607_0143 [Micromonospora coriariae]